MKDIVTLQPASISMPANDMFIGAALDFVQTLAAGLEFDVTEQNHIRLALEELICFFREVAIVDHDAAPLQFLFEPQVEGLSITIYEKGLPIDIKSFLEYSPVNIEQNLKLDGLSLHLAMNVMDSISFTNRGRDGLEVKMLKRRANAHIQQCLDSNIDTLSLPTVRYDTPPIYSVRPPIESESLEISRCAFLTYGYTYEDYIYYPDQITQMNATGELCSLIAVTEDNDVIGHSALKFSPQHTDRAELGVLCVTPEYRQYGIGSRLWGAAIELGKTQNLTSIVSRSVTGHLASQAIAQHHGFCDCALTLALFPRSVDLKDMGGTQDGKMSGMLQWLKLKPQLSRTINLPLRYQKIVTELYQRAEVEINIATLPDSLPESVEPIMRIETTPVLNVGRIEVESIGNDVGYICRWITFNFRQMCREKLDAIYISINMQQRGAAEVIEYATSHGFIFSGIFPGAFGSGDAILLQYLNLAEDPFKNLTVWTDTAQLLYDEIYAEWRACDTNRGFSNE